MLDPKRLKAIKMSARREEWSAVGDSLVALSAQAAGNSLELFRIKNLVTIIRGRNQQDVSGAVDQLLRLQKIAGIQTETLPLRLAKTRNKK